MRSIIQIGTVILLGLVFITIIGVGAFTYYQTPIVIEFLQKLHPVPSPIPHTVKGIAVVGDSLSDEYRADDNRGLTYASTTLNWVEILARKRMLNFGEWGLYEEPRRQGYAYNWARTAYNISGAIELGQHTGIAEQVKNDEVNTVIIYIGVNDFSPLAPDGYEAIYNRNVPEDRVTRKVNRIAADMKTIIETIQQADREVRILVVTIPDWGRHNLVQLAFPIPEQRRMVSDAILRTNDEFRKIAEDKDVSIANINDFYDRLETYENDDSLHVGGVSINKYLPGDDPRNLFLDDGVHPGTIFSGIFANFIINNLNTRLGTSIRPLSEKEIIESAGL